jgi:regulator of nonsense transcripts 2
VASIAAKLRRHKPEVCIRLLDAVLEELQLAMEFPSFKDQQRTLTMVRLLGELYGASLASAQLIIQQLYKFINFGHDIPPPLREASEKLADQVQAGNVPNSAGGVTQTIMEDEPMDEDDLQVGEPMSNEIVPVAVSKHSEYDPRVPTLLDTPDSAARVKLACTLLETVIRTIVTRSNLSKIEGFLTAFQRYLFTKTVLPAEVEFALLDTFDAIDSQWRNISKDPKSRKKSGENVAQGFPRFKTWLEAHNATVAVEESDAVAEERALTRLEHLAGDHHSVDGDETIASDLMDDEDDMMDEDEEASMDDALSVSAKDSVDDDHESYQQLSGDEAVEEGADGEDEIGEDDDDLDEDREDETDEEEDEEEEFDEEAYMQQLEAEAFELELRRLTMDALEKGKAVSRGGKVADSMPTGSQVIRKKSETETSAGFALGGKTGVSFQLLKKGNKGKMEAKQFFVPADTNLAAVATKQDDKAAKERDMIKARVLQYEAESAEAEVSGGNVYLEQEKLQVIRNRLSMEEIDRNFGTTGGNLRPADKTKLGSTGGRGPGRGLPSGGRGYGSGRGRGGGRNSGGRSLV